MKKTYKSPALKVTLLNGGAICESIIIGSGRSPQGTGNGTDLVKGDNYGRGNRSDYNVWDDDWSK